MLERHVSSGCSRMRRNFYVGKKKKVEESSQGKGSRMYHKASELHRVTECLSNRETYMDRMKPEGYGKRQTWRSRLGTQTK